MNTKFLGLHICNHLRWKGNTDSIILKSCAERYGVASLFHTGNTDTLEKIYFACFHTIVKYFYCCTVHFDNIKILFTNKCILLLNT